MRKLILAAAALTGIALISAAHAEPLPDREVSSPCWKWSEEGYHLLVCNRRAAIANTSLEHASRSGGPPNIIVPTAESHSQTSTPYGTVYSRTRYYGGR